MNIITSVVIAVIFSTGWILMMSAITELAKLPY